MRLEMRPPSDTDGTILMHNIADRDGRQILRKGIRLGPEHAGQLVRLGLDGVAVGVLGADDVLEDDAAQELAVVMQADALAHGGRQAGHSE